MSIVQVEEVSGVQPLEKTKKPWWKVLYFQVLIAILLGMGLGHFYPEIATPLKPLGDGFIRLIKMIIAPIVFCTIVTGIASMDNMKQVGRVGLKAIIYFQVMTTLALVIGLLVSYFFEPGVGMHVDPASLDPKSVEQYAAVAKSEGVADFFLNIIPKTVVDAFAKGELLQVLLFSILFAWSVLAMGEKGKPIVAGIDRVMHALFGVIALIMKLAPIGVFGAMAFTIGQYGIGSMVNLLYFMGLFYLTCVLFVVIGFGALMKFYLRLPLWGYLRYIREEIFIVLGTCSSETVLPRMLRKMQALGCPRPVVGLVLPTGYSFNLDGTAIYFTMAALFLAQATDTPMSWAEKLTLLAVLLVTSKGAAAVVGSAFVVLTGTLGTVGHIPVAAVALILGIDRFMAEARAITNLIGNGVATLVVAKWEKQLDHELARQVLAGEIPWQKGEELEELREVG